MCCKPIIVEQWYDKNGNFHSVYFASFDPARHTPKYFNRIRWTHSLVGRRKQQFVVVPCGKCSDCVRTKARDWKVRLYHHSLTEGEGIFVTLTYNDAHMVDKKGKPDCNLNYLHFQLFMKRLRHLFPDRNISMFCAGEYGSKSLRRHFHAIIFGVTLDMIKSQYLCRSRKDKKTKIWRSSILEKCWCTSFSRKVEGYNPDELRGFVSVSRVVSDNPSVFGYVAGYVISKYDETHRLAVFKLGLAPEFHHMSLKNAIGKNYFLKNCEAIYKRDFVWYNCRKVPVPKAYDRWYEKFTGRTVIKRLLCPKNIFDFAMSPLASSIFKMDFVFNYLKPGYVTIDKISDFDIIKSRRRLRALSSTGNNSLYNLDSLDINLNSVYKGYNSSRCLYNL